MKYHITKEGAKILISDMDDSHLTNTIKLISSNIKKAQNMLRVQFDATNLDTFSISKKIDYDKDRVRSIIEDNLGRIKLYVYEASIRGLDITPILQELHGRTGKTDVIPTSLLIEPPDEDKDEDYEEIPF